MDNSYETRCNWVLSIAQCYFPAIRLENFANLFKISLHIVVCLTSNITRPKSVRNFLILIFHLKYYLPTRSACIFFFLEHARYKEIISNEVDIFFSAYLDDWISLENFEENFMHEFPNTYTIVDTTEVTIQSYIPSSFSGKKHNFTLKYQLTVGSRTGEIVHIFGPIWGSQHDSTVWKDSGLGDFFFDMEEFCLGDRGYVGCLRVISPFKRKKNQQLNQNEISFNQKLSHYRILIENINSSLKNWSILSSVYRGSLDIHYKIFACCAILTNMSSSHIEFE